MRTTRGLGLRRLRGMLAAAAASGTLLSPVLAADPINVATYNLRVNKASDGAPMPGHTARRWSRH